MSKLNVDQQTPFMDKQRPACDKSLALNISIHANGKRWSKEILHGRNASWS